MRIGLIAFIALALMVPISYAVIDDVASGPEREARRALRNVFKNADRYTLEGTGWVTTLGPEGKSMTARVKVGPWSRDRRPFEVLSLERDGKKVPVPHRFAPPMPGRWMSQLARDPELLEENYRIRAEGVDTVAGRACHKIRIMSRYPDRPVHVLWVDKERPVVLRRDFVAGSGKRRMETGFDEVSIRERQRAPRESKDRPKRMQHEVGGPLSGFTVESTDDRDELDFHPIERGSLPHGFQRKRFRTMHLNLQWPVPRTLSAAVSIYSDGIEGLAVMQIRTSDLKTFEGIMKAHKDPQIWQAMSQSGFPKEFIRRGSSARVEIGDTTLMAAGSISQNEIKLLVAQFLTD